MAHNDTLRDKLISCLQNAHAMEHQIIQVLEDQVKDTQQYPQIQARVQQHLDETRMHEQRMADRLGAFNEKPSTSKAAGANLVGTLMGAASGAREDPLLKAARDDYMTEHMEIATYGALIATAQAFGDNETVLAAQANLRDEVRMANWLEHHLAEAVIYSYQEDGIALDQAQISSIQDVVIQSLQQAQSGLTGTASGMMTGDMMTGTTGTGAMPSATGMGRNPDRMHQSEATLNASGAETDTHMDYPSEQTNLGPNPSI